MSRAYVYVVDRDFGFAPNPFHGYCTLATCKPGIRAQARPGDWVIGMGGRRLKATGRCIFAMEVTERFSFDDYWSHQVYLDKRPVRNGSRTMMVGDNIYHREASTNRWIQADSHHSNVDGSPNLHNLTTDTKSDIVLLSRHFFYFGSQARTIPSHLLGALGYRNGRNYRVFDFASAKPVIEWLHNSSPGLLNLVAADPFDFASSEKRYSALNNKIT